MKFKRDGPLKKRAHRRGERVPSGMPSLCLARFESYGVKYSAKRSEKSAWAFQKAWNSSGSYELVGKLVDIGPQGGAESVLAHGFFHFIEHGSPVNVDECIIFRASSTQS